MFAKIIAFFKSLFGGLFGGTRKQPTYKDLPPEEKTVPQDGAEIPDDKKDVEVVPETDPVIVTEAEVEEELNEQDLDPTANTENENPPDDFGSDETIPDVEVPVVVEENTDPVVVEEEKPVEPEKPKHTPRYLWCLDNGHGKLVAGKRSPKLSNGDQLLEYEFNRDIVKRIIIALKAKGIKYFNVVPEVEIDNFLAGRVERANTKKSSLPKIFLSIHSNAHGNGGWDSVSGIETWFFHTSKSSKAIAKVFQNQLVKDLRWKNRNIKSYPGSRQFYVLRETKMPAVLTENGFFTNVTECKELLKPTVRQTIAEAHVKAIEQIEKNGIFGVA